MKKKNKNTSKNIKLIGKTRQEISELLGNDYVFDKELRSAVYHLKHLYFFKKKIYVEFDENNFADTVIGL